MQQGSASSTTLRLPAHRTGKHRVVDDALPRSRLAAPPLCAARLYILKGFSLDRICTGILVSS